MTPVAFSGCDAFDGTIESPNLALSIGDAFIVWSNDAITGVTPHQTNQYPMEIHQVKDIRDTTQILFDDFIADAMSTTPLIAKPTLIRGVRIADLGFSYTSTSDNTRAVDIRRMQGLVMEDCNWEAVGPGPLLITHSLNTVVRGVHCESKQNYDTDFGYHVVPGLVNGFLFQDSIVKGTRHAFTTTSGATDGAGTNWGTQRNVKVVNVIAKNSTKPSGTALVCFDTHPYGYGILFESCKAVLPSENTAIVPIGFQSRSRRTLFKGCTVEGAQVGCGFNLLADRCEVADATTEGCWFGVRVEDSGSRIPSGCVIQGGTIRDCIGPGIYIEIADDLEIFENLIKNCGSGSGLEETLIELDAGTAIRIHRNGLRKVSNVSSIHTGAVAAAEIEIAGNTMLGYGAGLLGMAGTNAVAIEAAAQPPQNIADAGFQQLGEMTAPAAPEANKVRLFAEDNGSGKTRLMARFPTGATQQVAIEP